MQKLLLLFLSLVSISFSGFASDKCTEIYESMEQANTDELNLSIKVEKSDIAENELKSENGKVKLIFLLKKVSELEKQISEITKNKKKGISRELSSLAKKRAILRKYVEKLRKTEMAQDLADLRKYLGEKFIQQDCSLENRNQQLVKDIACPQGLGVHLDDLAAFAKDSLAPVIEMEKPKGVSEKTAMEKCEKLSNQGVTAGACEKIAQEPSSLEDKNNANTYQANQKTCSKSEIYLTGKCLPKCSEFYYYEMTDEGLQCVPDMAAIEKSHIDKIKSKKRWRTFGLVGASIGGAALVTMGTYWGFKAISNWKNGSNQSVTHHHTYSPMGGNYYPMYYPQGNYQPFGYYPYQMPTSTYENSANFSYGFDLSK